jgi:hypothetical protein
MALQQPPRNADLLDADLRWAGQHPGECLAGLALVFAASVLFTVIVYGYAHKVCGAFTEADQRETMRKSKRLLPAVKSKLTDLEARTAAREKELRDIDAMLAERAGAGSTAQLDALLRRRDQLRSESASKPIVLLPFFPSTLTVVWPIMYTTLGWLIFVVPPYFTPRIRRCELASLSATTGCLYVLFHWPTWVRNFVIGNEGRVVYASTNYDVSRPLFFCQEAVGLGMCILLALVWRKWLYYFQRQWELLSAADGETPSIARAPGIADRLGKSFALWQLSSLVLACGFLSFSYFHWQNIFVFRDYRYLVHAITTHVLWAVTWGLISLPLIAIWHDWYILRMRWFAGIAAEARDKNDAEVQIKALQEIQPIAVWNTVATALVSAGGFVAPLLQHALA